MRIIDALSGCTESKVMEDKNYTINIKKILRHECRLPKLLVEQLWFLATLKGSSNISQLFVLLNGFYSKFEHDFHEALLGAGKNLEWMQTLVLNTIWQLSVKNKYDSIAAALNFLEKICKGSILF